MTPADRQVFGAFLLGLGETYGEPVSDARLEIYWRALEDLPLEAVRQAANVHVRTQRFFPRPAELREACAGTAEDRAEIAWNAVRRLVRRLGYYQTPAESDWPDEATKRAALELYGGWGALCAKLPGEGPEFLGCAKQFKAAYAACARRDDRVAALPSHTDARRALGDIKAALTERGQPTGSL